MDQSRSHRIHAGPDGAARSHRCRGTPFGAHLAEYGADPNRLYVSGHSAGGHLTAMTMPLAEVHGGIAISGIYDLEPIRLNYLNEKLGLDAAEADRNSPVRHLPAKVGELVVAYGTRELDDRYYPLVQD
jgi:arylformamidase